MEEIKAECLKLMKAVEDAYLGTIDSDGFPQIRVMANLRNQKMCNTAPEIFKSHDEDFLLYMATGHSSDKMKQIRANPKISVYFYKAGEMHTLRLVGSAEEINDLELKKQLWQDEWEMHWPGGVEDPELVIIRLEPDYAKGWYNEGPYKFNLK